jgi:hypothetical protein
MTVAMAVGAYLDCEHYIHLHEKWSSKYEILHVEPLCMTVKQTWKMFGFFPIGQVYKTQYLPPARFLNHSIKPYPFWFPSIHHLLKITTDQKYSESPQSKKTISRLDVEIEMPFFLWPFRKLIQRSMTELKSQKDAEDIRMIQRRSKLFGENCHLAYLVEHQFILHKDEYCKHFGNLAKETM